MVCNLSYCDQHFDKNEQRCLNDMKALRIEAGSSSLHNSGDDRVRQMAHNLFHPAGKEATAGGAGAGAGAATSNGAVVEGGLDASAVDSLFEDEGLLFVNVVQAHDLTVADSNGFSDPYAIVYFEDKEYRTETKYETLSPVWKQTFTIRTRGYGHVIHVGVYDWDRTKSDDFLGMVSVPLSVLENGRLYDRWYPLHVRPGKLGAKDNVRGDIHLQIQYVYKVKMLFKPIRPNNPDLDRRIQSGEEVDEEDYDQARQVSNPKFSRRILARNFARVKRLFQQLHTDRLSKSIDDTLAWKSPAQSLFWLVFLLYLIAYLPLRVVPALPFLAMLYILVSNFVSFKFFGTGVPQDGANLLPPCVASKLAEKEKKDRDQTAGPFSLEENGNSPDPPLARSLSSEETTEAAADTLAFDDVPEEKEEAGASEKEKSGMMAALRKFEEELRNIQNKLGDACVIGESVESLFSWRDPMQSQIFTGAMLVISVLLMIIPFRLLLGLVGMYPCTTSSSSSASSPFPSLFLFSFSSSNHCFFFSFPLSLFLPQ